MDLDRFMAEKVFGWKCDELHWHKLNGEYEDGSPCWEWICDIGCLPKFSTDIAQAFEVVERMRELGWRLCVNGNAAWFYRRDARGETPVFREKVLSTSICLAAKTALENS